MKRSKMLVMILVVALIWASGIYNIAAAVVSKDLEVVETATERDEYGVLYIVGKLKNNNKKTYSYVQVTFNLYDNDGAQIGTTLANTTNLEGGGVWKFKAVILEDNAAKYKLTGIDAF